MAMNSIASSDYLRLIEPWLKPALEYTYSPPDREDLESFGPGFNNWGVQTNQKGLAAFAVCAADPEFDENRAGLSRDEVLDHALRMLRFSLESHLSNTYQCTDNTQWGHHWISPLGVERMMHGVTAIEEHLTDNDKELLRKVLVSEALWFLDEYEIVAGLYNKDHNNKPESNLWNGAIMLRTAMMYPDIERVDEIREKGITFLINSISVPDDGNNEDIVDGKPVRERFIGPNFFESYALNHHGYLNTGYMVICLSNAAMLYFSFKEKGIDPPEALFHHVKELWGLVKELTLPDGRLLRIGGDTRVRYCYCQDYCMPSWLMMEECFGDADCTGFEQGWLGLVEKETGYNNTGLFLSERCSKLSQTSPLYYTRLESDRACTLSMGAYWRRVFDIPGEVRAEPSYAMTAWHDEYHGSVMHKSPNRITSWTWDAGEKPQGLAVIPQKSDLAEWRENMAAEIRGEGSFCFQELVSHKEQQFEGGFLTWGSTSIHSNEMTAEGQQLDNDDFASQFIVCAALPDNTTMAVLQYVTTGSRAVCVSSVKGIHFHVPNDLFNGNHRTYFVLDMQHEVVGNSGQEEILSLYSSWINADNILGLTQVYGGDMLRLFRPGKRQIGLKNYPNPKNWRAGGMLYTDEICSPCITDTQMVPPETVLVDTGFAVQINVSKEDTAAFTEQAAALHKDDSSFRAIRIQGASGETYIIISNLAESETTAAININGSAVVDLVTGEEIDIKDGIVEVEIKGRAARVFKISSK
jgi:hypothetical protein